MKLSVILEAIDRVTKPVRAITSTVQRLNSELGLSRLAQSAGRVGTAFGSVAKEARDMAMKVTTAVGLVAGGLLAITRRSADAAGTLKDTVAKVGMGAEGFQRLGWAAKLASSDPAELAQGLTLFNRQINAAARGNKGAAAEFRSLGINIKDAHGKLKPTETLFREIAERISKMPDGAAKTATAMKFFGRSGANLIPVLNLGAQGLKDAGDEAERLGKVLSADAVEAGDDASDNMDKLTAAGEGLGNTIAGKLIPIINPLVLLLIGWMEANRELIATRIEEFVSGLPGFLTQLHDTLLMVYTVMKPVIAVFEMLANVIGPANTALILFGVIVGGKFIMSVGSAVMALGGFGKAFTLTSMKMGRMLLGPVIAAIWNFVTAIRAGYGVMAAFNLVISANPIGAIILGIAALAAGAYLIYRNWGSIAPWFGQLFASLQKIFGGFIDFIAGVFTLDFGRAWGGLTSIFQGWVDWFNTLLGGVIGTISELGSGVKRVASFIGISSDDDKPSPKAPPGSPPTGGSAAAYRRLETPGTPAADTSRPRAADIPVAARVQVGGELHVQIDSDGKARVISARSDNPRVPLTVDAGRVMP